jgi:hypothetical protein
MNVRKFFIQDAREEKLFLSKKCSETRVLQKLMPYSHSDNHCAIIKCEEVTDAGT